VLILDKIVAKTRQIAHLSCQVAMASKVLYNEAKRNKTAFSWPLSPPRTQRIVIPIYNFAK